MHCQGHDHVHDCDSFVRIPSTTDDYPNEVKEFKWRLVPENLSGTVCGTYNAIIGLLAFPASLIAGVLWQGAGFWQGFGPSAPFLFGGILALIAAVLMAFWLPKVQNTEQD